MENAQEILDSLFSQQEHEDLVITACEGGCSYWGEINETPTDFPPSGEGKAFSERLFDYLWNRDGTITVSDVEDSETTYLINKKSLTDAVALMAKDYKEHFADVISENWDADTADVYFQLACCGQIVYG